MTPPHRICFKCSYEANIAQIVCPRCGGKMKSKSQIRVLGGVLTLISGFLVVFISVIAFFIYNTVQQSDKPGATSKFTGSENDILIIIAIFGACYFIRYYWFDYRSLAIDFWQTQSNFGLFAACHWRGAFYRGIYP